MKIDKEFESLIPPLSDEEFKQLEENILAEGCRESILVWMNEGEFVIIDGHNRYKICKKHNLPYNHRQMHFKDRNEVIHWMILNQFGRRNLSAYDRSILALRLKPVIQEQAKEQQIRKSVSQKSVEQKPIDTQKELAKVAGVSHDTIHKVEVIEKKAPEEIKEKVRKGDISINSAYNLTLPPAKVKQKSIVQQAKEEHKQFEETKKDSVVSISDVKQDKENQEIINHDLYNKVSNIVKLFDWLMEEDIDAMVKDLDRYACGDLDAKLSRCGRHITSLRRKLEERRING